MLLLASWLELIHRSSHGHVPPSWLSVCKYWTLHKPGGLFVLMQGMFTMGLFLPGWGGSECDKRTACFRLTDEQLFAVWFSVGVIVSNWCRYWQAEIFHLSTSIWFHWFHSKDWIIQCDFQKLWNSTSIASNSILFVLEGHFAINTGLWNSNSRPTVRKQDPVNSFMPSLCNRLQPWRGDT